MAANVGLSRREWLQASAALGGWSLGRLALGQEKAEPRGKPTKFQIACMTLPYSQYPLARALSGIKSAGYEYVAWGTSHREEGEAAACP